MVVKQQTDARVALEQDKIIIAELRDQLVKLNKRLEEVHAQQVDVQAATASLVANSQFVKDVSDNATTALRGRLDALHASMAKRLAIKITRMPTVGYFQGRPANTTHDLGKHQYCAITTTAWLSNGVAAGEKNCDVTVSADGTWTYAEGVREGCAVTCFDATLE